MKSDFHMAGGSGGSSGFTLIEVLVAVALTSLCVALVAISFGATFRAHQRAREYMDLLQVQTESLERLRTLLQSAYLSHHAMNQIYTPFETMDMDNLSSPYDAVTFTTLAYTTYKIDAKEADMAEMTIFAEDEPPLEADGERLELKRLRVRVGGEINDRFEVEGGLVYTLADHVTEFYLEYLNEFGEWKPEWVPIDHDPYSLPCAVRVTLGLRGDELGEEKASIIVPFEMTKLTCRFEDERPFEQ